MRAYRHKWRVRRLLDVLWRSASHRGDQSKKRKSVSHLKNLPFGVEGTHFFIQTCYETLLIYSHIFISLLLLLKKKRQQQKYVASGSSPWYPVLKLVGLTVLTCTTGSCSAKQSYACPLRMSCPKVSYTCWTSNRVVLQLHFVLNTILALNSVRHLPAHSATHASSADHIAFQYASASTFVNYGRRKDVILALEFNQIGNSAQQDAKCL